MTEVKVGLKREQEDIVFIRAKIAEKEKIRKRHEKRIAELTEERRDQ